MAKKNEAEVAPIVVGRKPVKNVTGFKAAGSWIMVELLDEAEILNTRLTLVGGGGKAKVEAPQGYVLEFGPNLDASKLGVRVGDRVVFSGGFVPLPKGAGERQKGVIDFSSVRAVLVEGEEVLETSASGSGLIV